MKRTRLALWLLLLVQVVPVAVVIAARFGLFDPMGHFIEQSVSVPISGALPRFIVNATRFIVVWWFLACIWLMFVGSVAAIMYVAFDRTLTKLERFVWATSFVIGQFVTVSLYCVLKLLGKGRIAPQLSVA